MVEESKIEIIKMYVVVVNIVSCDFNFSLVCIWKCYSGSRHKIYVFLRVIIKMLKFFYVSHWFLVWTFSNVDQIAFVIKSSLSES